MSDIEFPPLPYADWVDTKETLHLFLQIIGKIRMVSHPKLNHWWHVTLYPSAHGLTTGRIPYRGGGFQIDVDFVNHRVQVSAHNGKSESFDMPGKSVADFYNALLKALHTVGIDVEINTRPYENVSTIPFPEDDLHNSYDIEAVSRYWQALYTTAGVFETYRGLFAGKQTPVQLYWHSFDLVVTRFSGRAAPLENARTQSDREAYSHEVISVGFWPGDNDFQQAAYYGYAYPEPDGLNVVPLLPEAATWAERNGGALAVLTYDDMRRNDHPQQALLSFVESLYEGAAEKSGWDKADYRHAFS